jgi:hypothetical protein
MFGAKTHTKAAEKSAVVLPGGRTAPREAGSIGAPPQ